MRRVGLIRIACLAATFLVALIGAYSVFNYDGFSVRADGENWMSARCYSSVFGWRTLSELAKDPRQQANRAISEIRTELMAGLNEGRQAWTPDDKTAPGVHCEHDVPIRPPNGIIWFGDFYPTRCHALWSRVQSCFAAHYNQAIIDNSNYPKKKNCQPSGSRGCDPVEAWWKAVKTPSQKE